MPKAIQELFPFLPDWSQQFFICLLALMTALGIIRKILAHLQSKEIRSAWQAAKKTGSSLAQQMAKQIQLPRPYPCAELFLHILFTINNYLGVFIFSLFVVLIIVLIVTASTLAFLKFLTAIAVALIAIYFAAFFLAEAERGRIAIPELLAKCRNKSTPSH